MKKYVLFLIFIVVSISSYSQYDKAKHYQWRSMEDGPWEFDPKDYYYSWYMKKILFIKTKVPGLGVHDNGPAGVGIGGDGYVNKYAPVTNNRLAATASALVEAGSYKKEYDNINSWNNRELQYSADRTVDLALPVLKSKFTNSQERFLKNITAYTSLCSNDKELKYGNHLLNEYNRILDNKTIIEKAYIENSKRQESYLEMTTQLDNLNSSVVALIKIAYNKKENINYFKK
jgi:hypothetical protein